MNRNKSFASLRQAFWISGPKLEYGPEDAGYYEDHPTVILHQTFEVSKPDSNPDVFILQIACLGLYKLSVNGKELDDAVLRGSWTAFDKIVYADEIDLGKYIHTGINTLDIELGNGYYNPSPLRFFGKYNLRKNLREVGTPCLCCALLENGIPILQSDASWTWTSGQIVFNNIYLGERADLNREDPAPKPVRAWKQERNLQRALADPIRKTTCVRPVSITSISVLETEDGLLADFGEMITGWAEIEVNGQADQEIRLQFAEALQNGKPDFRGNANGSVGDIMPDGNKVDGGPGAPEQAIQEDVIVLAPGKNTYQPSFTYHSFRYVLLKNLKRDQILDLKAWYVHADFRQTGFVQSDNPVYTQLMDAALRTRLNNAHFSFEDCSRERLGYGGDMICLADGNMLLFDLHNFYRKIILDFRLEQTEAGGIPETAPYMGIQSQGTANKEGPLMWQYVYPFLCQKMLQYYNDEEFVRQEYPYLKRQMDYLLAWDPEKLAAHCLGDHGSILIAGQFYTPTPAKEFTGWCAQVLFLDTFLDISESLGIPEEKLTVYLLKEHQLRDEINARFRLPDGSYADHTQTALAFAAWLQLDDPKILTDRLARKMEEEGLLTTGIFGARFAYELLHRYDHDDLVEKWLLSKGEYSFRGMLAAGNKAFAELFKGTHYSFNHAMFTSFTLWYDQALAGITLEKEYGSVTLHPYFSPEIKTLQAEITCAGGIVSSSWTRTGDLIDWVVMLPEKVRIAHMEIPENCRLHLMRQAPEAAFRSFTRPVYPMHPVLPGAGTDPVIPVDQTASESAAML